MRSEYFTLSEIQKAYYMGRNEGFELGGKSTQITYVFETELDCDKLESAINREVLRQPMLRSVVLSESKQKILDETPYYHITRIDLSGATENKKNETLENEKRKAFSKKFVPDQWPLFEWKYITTGGIKNYVIVSFDLLIADGSSLMIYANEVRMIYDGREDELPPLSRTYMDFVREKEEKRKSKKYLSDKQYWLDRMDEIHPAPELPYRKMRSPEVRGEEVYRSVMYLDEKNWADLCDSCNEHGVTPTIAVLTAYAMTLGYWSEEKNFTINMTVTERKRNKMENVVGDYTSSVLIPVDKEVAVSDDFWAGASTLGNIFRSSYRHASFEGVELIKEIARHRNMTAMSVMPIVFTSLLFKDKLYDNIYQIGKLVDAISKTPQVIIDCQIEENNNKLVVTWDYVSEYLDEKLIGRMQAQMKDILICAADDNRSYDSSLVLTDDEQALWEKYNDTDDNTIEDKNLIEMFDETVKRFPDRVAVSDGKKSCTYREADEISDRIAAYLASQGVSEGDYAAVITEREVSSVLNILGILKTGAAYIPIAPDVGVERRKYIIEHSGCKAVLDADIDVSDHEAVSFRDRYSRYRDSCAYVIYTSGTTGEPKGVVIRHKAAANTIQDINSRLGINENDRIIGLSSMTFDLSVYDIFGAFHAGAELVMVKDNRDPRLIKRLAEEKRITVWNSVPSIFELFLSFVRDGDSFENIRCVLLSGDKINTSLPDRIKKHCPKAEVYSLGGATEASIWSIIYPIEKVDPHWKSIPYGYPMKNQKIYVTNPKGRLCSVSVTGEICIGGIGLADGYLNSPEKTAKAFVDVPKLGHIYRTGDLGVMEPDGYVRIIGRIDHQMKINGYRIEADEITSQVMRYSKDIRNTAVVPYRKKTKLCCFAETTVPLDTDKLIDHLSQYLPPYMIPSKIITIEKLPLSSNGKVSGKKLVEMAEQIEDAVRILPRTETEKMLCGIWEQVMERDSISIDQSFFELGGDSIKAAEVFGILEEKGYEVEMSVFFRNNTIEKLARAIDEKTSVTEETDSGEI